MCFVLMPIRKIGATAPLLACVTASVLLLGCPDDPAGPYTWTVTKDLVYAVGNVSDGSNEPVWEQKELLIDAYEPADTPDANRPAILLVHGGSFTEGSKEKEEIVEYAEYFASHGYVAFTMNYRLNADYPPAPDDWSTIPLSAAVHAAIVDIKAAVRYIRANAEAYGIDAGQIALLGESAGAIAGVAVAVTDPDGYASDGPDFPIPEFNHPDASPAVQAYIHLWGNADHVLFDLDSNDPPTMIVHGDEDDEFFTPIESARRFHALLDLLGVPNEFYEAEGFGHGAWDYRKDRKGVKRLALEFLDVHLLGNAPAKLVVLAESTAR